MAKLLAYTIALFFVLPAPSYACDAIHRLDPNRGKLIEDCMKRDVEELKKGLPTKLDHITTFESANLFGKLVTYEYTLDVSKEEAIRRQIVVQTKSKLKEYMCANQPFAFLIENDVKYGYVYSDKNANIIGHFVVDKHLCGF
ncbi:MAG: hypothetical protein AB3N20_01020 [Rhizobiaceae bacterium]